ncbi:MAG: rhodanese-like domain-containing protein [Chloroflexi bacterium]|nr:rhodanese-like domain-containing protein [Chloroflexota bacterium]
MYPIPRSLIIITVFILAACSGTLSESPEAISNSKSVITENAYTNISVSELQNMLENKDFLFVNVHIPVEGVIPGTDLSIPFDEIEANLDKLPEDKDTNIVLYCLSNGMSRVAAEELAGLSYENLYNLDGGYTAWQAAGLPFEDQ